MRVTIFSHKSVAMYPTLANLVIDQIRFQIGHQDSDQNVDGEFPLYPPLITFKI